MAVLEISKYFFPLSFNQIKDKKFLFYLILFYQDRYFILAGDFVAKPNRPSSS